MNGYKNEETYSFALWYLDHLQEIHAENKFSSVDELKEYALELIAEHEFFDTLDPSWVQDVLKNEVPKIDFQELYNLLD
jgi:hypothetical protein